MRLHEIRCSQSTSFLNSSYISFVTALVLKIAKIAMSLFIKVLLFKMRAIYQHQQRISIDSQLANCPQRQSSLKIFLHVSRMMM